MDRRKRMEKWKRLKSGGGGGGGGGVIAKEDRR